MSLFVDDFLKKESLRSQLGTLNDLERSAARLVGLNRNPKELRTLASSIKAVFSLSAHLEGLSTQRLDEMKDTLNTLACEDVGLLTFCDQLQRAFSEDVAAVISHPGVIEMDFQKS